jgi:hypothetical protein
LGKKMQSMLFERTALSRKPEKLIRQELDGLKTQDTLTPDLVFRDPYMLDFLGLSDPSPADASLAKNRHHRTPLGKRRLEQVQSHKQREPQEVRVDVDPQQDARGHETARNHPQPPLNSHDAPS